MPTHTAWPIATRHRTISTSARTISPILRVQSLRDKITIHDRAENPKGPGNTVELLKFREVKSKGGRQSSVSRFTPMYSFSSEYVAGGKVGTIALDAFLAI
jgi:hypothetical protein